MSATERALENVGIACVFQLVVIGFFSYSDAIAISQAGLSAAPVISLISAALSVIAVTAMIRPIFRHAYDREIWDDASQFPLQTFASRNCVLLYVLVFLKAVSIGAISVEVPTAEWFGTFLSALYAILAVRASYRIYSLTDSDDAVKYYTTS